MNEIEEFIKNGIKWMYNQHRIIRVHDSKVVKAASQSEKQLHQNLKSIFLADRRMFWRETETKVANFIEHSLLRIVHIFSSRDVFYILYCLNVFEQIGADFSREKINE